MRRWTDVFIHSTIVVPFCSCACCYVSTVKNKLLTCRFANQLRLQWKRNLSVTMETAKERVERIQKEALTRQTLLAVKVCKMIFDWLVSCRAYDCIEHDVV